MISSAVAADTAALSTAPYVPSGNTLRIQVLQDRCAKHPDIDQSGCVIRPNWPECAHLDVMKNKKRTWRLRSFAAPCTNYRSADDCGKTSNTMGGKPTFAAVTIEAN